MPRPWVRAETNIETLTVSLLSLLFWNRLVTLKAECTIYSFYITRCWFQMCPNPRFVRVEFLLKLCRAEHWQDGGEIRMNLLRYMMTPSWRFRVVDMRDARAARYKALRLIKTAWRMQAIQSGLFIIAAFIFGALIMNLCTYKSLWLN